MSEKHSQDVADRLEWAKATTISVPRSGDRRPRQEENSRDAARKLRAEALALLDNADNLQADALALLAQADRLQAEVLTLLNRADSIEGARTPARTGS